MCLLITLPVVNPVDPKFKDLGDAKYSELMSWFNKRLDDAIQAAEEDKKDGSAGAIFSDGK